MCRLCSRYITKRDLTQISIKEAFDYIIDNRIELLGYIGDVDPSHLCKTDDGGYWFVFTSQLPPKVGWDYKERQYSIREVNNILYLYEEERLCYIIKSSRFVY
jgi:hypothetical protein